MFYIINRRTQIIAADTALLSLLNINHIDDLTKQIILGNIQLNSAPEKGIEFITDHGTFTYETQTSSLSSLLGDLQLVHLIPISEDSIDVAPLLIDNDKDTSSTENIDDIDELILVKNEAPLATEDAANITSIHPKKTEEFSLLDSTNIPTETELPLIEETHNDALFDLTIPNTPEVSIDEISLEGSNVEKETINIEKTQKKTVENTAEIIDSTPIVINIDEVSENIGISSDDYRAFLNEYISTSISLEDDLKSTDTTISTSAVNTLTQLADVLELPIVNDIISELTTSTPDKVDNIVNAFYTTLSRLTTEKKPNSPSDTANQAKDNDSQIALDMNTDALKDTKTEKNLEPINLTDIQPIYFDFKLEEAANDLSLPVELIEEFVHDFIEQAHIETEKMLIAYEKGDLDSIQKAGHILKGASSNLRINTLSDTLYNIQFCEDISQLEGYIKKYWGHFLSFEQQIDTLSNKGNN